MESGRIDVGRGHYSEIVVWSGTGAEGLSVSLERIISLFAFGLILSSLKLVYETGRLKAFQESQNKSALISVTFPSVSALHSPLLLNRLQQLDHWFLKLANPPSPFIHLQISPRSKRFAAPLCSRILASHHRRWPSSLKDASSICNRESGGYPHRVI